jgi:hypothetical protein
MMMLGRLDAQSNPIWQGVINMPSVARMAGWIMMTRISNFYSQLITKGRYHDDHCRLLDQVMRDEYNQVKST